MKKKEQTDCFGIHWRPADELPETREMCCVSYRYRHDGIYCSTYGTARRYGRFWYFTRRVPKGASVIKWQYFSLLPRQFQEYIVPLPLDEKRRKKRF